MTATIILSQKLELARFLSGVDAEGRRIAPAFRSVLFLLVDCAAARSLVECAHCCGVRRVREDSRSSLCVLESAGRSRPSPSSTADRCEIGQRRRGTNMCPPGRSLVKNICAVARNKVRSLDRTFMAVSDLFF